jgi:acetyl-CoA C-acetyltransferase
MIGFPYLKLMNANIQTDQAAAVILCSVEAARSAGVPEDRWVFIHAGADGHDHWFVSERADLRSSPAVRACGRAAFELSGTTVDDMAHVDLYSCFPSAVQVAAAELGLGLDEPDRPLTVTGGLTFAGGPGNNYVTHSISTMADVLRSDPGALGMVTALGWYMTKHSVAVYGTAPPADGFRWRSVQDEVDRLPRRQPVADHDGPAEIEAYTVMHERDGSPVLGIVACLLPDGRRGWANVHEAGLLARMTAEEWVGRPVTVRPGGELEPAG